jgi:hypothetical protein
MSSAFKCFVKLAGFALCVSHSPVCKYLSWQASDASASGLAHADLVHMCLKLLELAAPLSWAGACQLVLTKLHAGSLTCLQDQGTAAPTACPLPALALDPRIPAPVAVPTQLPLMPPSRHVLVEMLTGSGGIMLPLRLLPRILTSVGPIIVPLPLRPF